MTRESLQRMIPASSAVPPSSAPASNGSGAAAPPSANRAFEYRFSKPYISTLPAAQRPVEREIFGEWKVGKHQALALMNPAIQVPFPFRP